MFLVGSSRDSNYMMFEVLETSWGMLQENLDSATTLDDLIEAHQSYMKGILTRALLNDESLEVHNKVHEVGRCSYSCDGSIKTWLLVHVQCSCHSFSSHDLCM